MKSLLKINKTFGSKFSKIGRLQMQIKEEKKINEDTQFKLKMRNIQSKNTMRKFSPTIQGIRTNPLKNKFREFFPKV